MLPRCGCPPKGVICGPCSSEPLCKSRGRTRVTMVATIVTRVLPLLLQSGSLLQGPQITPFGGQPHLGSIIGQNPYTPFQSGLFQNPIGGLGSLGSPWGTPFGHY